jgi:glycosyltransferase involved in cell wall biosynthesis
MRILFANKFWYGRGGQERVMFDEIRWLEEAGHEVAHFSTSHPQNDPSAWSDYFAPSLELGATGSLTMSQSALAAARMFHNGAAVRQFSRLMRDFGPDLIHAHGIHRQISPSVLTVARRAGIPVVHSLHDYHLVCPADTLLRKRTQLCIPRRCGTLWFGACVSARCVRGRALPSILSAAETSWARVRRSYERGVTRFISPSHFLWRQMESAGWKLPVDVIPNAVPTEVERAETGHGFVISGRLSFEKGVAVALDAAQSARVSVTVAGDGPLRDQLKEAYPAVAFTGHLSGESVRDLVRRARAVVVPSVWFENAPMSILEAMASGVPVIASRIGGIPEQVTHMVDGILVTPGDASELSQAMRLLEDDSELAQRLGSQAQKTVARRFSPEAHLEALLKTYQACLRP